MAVVYSGFEEAAEKYWNPKREQAKTNQNKIYDAQVKTVNDTYNAEIERANTEYENTHRDNAIQKLINEREVTENMANMGLNNSGLGRLQQTAVQLLYANNRAEIQRAKQQQVESLARGLAAELSSIAQKRTAGLDAIDKEYDGYISNAASTNYKSALDAETERIENYNSHIEKLAANPTNIISKDGAPLSRDFKNGGSLKDNGVTVTYNIDKSGNRTTTTYYDTITGKKTTVAYSVNPYKNTNNAVGSSDTAKAWKTHGAFENGYQPKGVFYNGKDYGAVSDSGIRDMINGNMQRIHKTKDNTLWIWDGKNNKYLLYEE